MIHIVYLLSFLLLILICVPFISGRWSLAVLFRFLGVTLIIIGFYLFCLFLDLLGIIDQLLELEVNLVWSICWEIIKNSITLIS